MTKPKREDQPDPSSAADLVEELEILSDEELESVSGGIRHVGIRYVKAASPVEVRAADVRAQLPNVLLRKRPGR